MSSGEAVSSLHGLRVVQEMVYSTGWCGEITFTLPSFTAALADVTLGLLRAFGGTWTGRVYSVPNGAACSACKGTGKFEGRATEWLGCGKCSGRGKPLACVQEVHVLSVSLLAPMLDQFGNVVEAPISAAPIADACGERSMFRAASGFIAAASLFAGHEWCGTAVDASDWFVLACDKTGCRKTVRCGWPFVWAECECVDGDRQQAAKFQAAEARLAMSVVDVSKDQQRVSSGFVARRIAKRFWDVEVHRQVDGLRKNVALSEAVRWWLLVNKTKRLRS